MPGIVRTFSTTVLCLSLSCASVTAEDVSDTAKIAGLSDFGAKLDSLEQAVDDIALTGALALLKPAYPAWEFGGSSGFGSVQTGVSNDLGAVAASHEYAMGKLRGAIHRNALVSDDQREQALQLHAQVKELILIGYELEGLIADGDMQGAGEVYRGRLVTLSDQLIEEINTLSGVIEQAIKFASL